LPIAAPKAHSSSVWMVREHATFSHETRQRRADVSDSAGLASAFWGRGKAD
jgi:hypothetical protein